MKNLILPFFFSLACVFELVGCGVKGKPLPPLTPPVLGRGEPNYSKATEDVKIRKASTKKNPSQGEQDDWDDE